MVFSRLKLESIFCVEPRVEDQRKNCFMAHKYMWNTCHSSTCSPFLQFHSLLFPMHAVMLMTVGQGLALAQQPVSAALQCAEGVSRIVLSLRSEQLTGLGPLRVLGEEKEQTSQNVLLLHLLHLLLCDTRCSQCNCTEMEFLAFIVCTCNFGQILSHILKYMSKHAFVRQYLNSSPLNTMSDEGLHLIN